MKKILYLMLSVIIIVFCIGCGNNKPSDISKDMYDIGTNTVKVTESYLSTDITAKEASEKLKTLEKQAEESCDANYSKDDSIKTEVSCISTFVNNNYLREQSSDSSISYSSIKETLTNLKNNLNIK
nr:MAG TPA: protein of unknown function (DUF4969) [Caudoviricetes sp.]